MLNLRFNLTNLKPQLVSWLKNFPKISFSVLSDFPKKVHISQSRCSNDEQTFYLNLLIAKERGGVAAGQF